MLSKPRFKSISGLAFGLLAALALLLAAGCEEDTSTGSPQGTANLSFSSTNAAHTTGVAAMWRNIQRWVGVPSAQAFSVGTDTAGNAVEVTDFLISIREIKFKLEGADDAALDADDVEFQGPFVIDLLDDTAPLAQSLGETAFNLHCLISTYV